MKTILEKTKTEKSIRDIYIFSLVLLLLTYLVTLYANKQLVKQAERVQHTNKVIKNLDNMLSNVKDAETGTRGYIITGDIRFLFPYYGTAGRIDSIYSVAVQLTRDSPLQSGRIHTLKRFIDKRMALLQFSIKSFEGNNRQRTDSMIKLQPESIRLMDSIHTTVSLLQREEERLLNTRSQKMQLSFKTIRVISFISLILAFALIVFGFFSYMQVSKSRKKAQQAILDYEQRLKNRIQELDEANEELIRMRSEEKFAATGRIARTIAHEVRNPLTNINLASDQLKNEFLQKEENSAFLFDMINRNSNRINQLISDLLNSTKFSELNYVKTGINDFIDETLKDAEDRIKLDKIQLIKKYSSRNCAISVDKAKMKIALLNIIINAIEAMEIQENRILTIETRPVKDKCEIIITDNGPGMDEESLTRIFEPYFTNKMEGNGLGLTNTQNIILNHHGEILVKSTRNKGTSFIITLGILP